jgi:IQ calmodulin-binding motif
MFALRNILKSVITVQRALRKHRRRRVSLFGLRAQEQVASIPVSFRIDAKTTFEDASLSHSMRVDRFVILIQKVWRKRRMIATEKYACSRFATLIQAVWRNHRIIAREKHEFREQNATIIQARWRSHRKASVTMCSIIIQKAWAVHRSSRSINALIKRRQIMENKATTIQSVWRRHRRFVKESRAIIIQRRWRSLYRDKRATKIQRIWRQRLRLHQKAMKTLQVRDCHTQLTLIQRRWRLHRRAVLTSSSTIIQKAWRRHALNNQEVMVAP